MASIFRIKNKGFTLLEMTVVVFLVGFMITIISTSYFAFMKTVVDTDRKVRALENVQLGTEKVWRLLKYGWSFQNLGDGIIFQDNNCNTTTIIATSSNIFINTEHLFDPDLVRVVDFKVATDTPSTNETYAYFQYAPKLIVLYYNLELKGRSATTSLIFQQAVAPVNSLYISNKCE